MDIVIERGGLRDATWSEYRQKAIPLLGVTHADPQARVHMRADSADPDKSAALHFDRLGQGSSDERRDKLVTLAVEC